MFKTYLVDIICKSYSSTFLEEDTERGKYFRNTRFVTEWMNAAKPLIDRLTEILEHSTDE